MLREPQHYRRGAQGPPRPTSCNKEPTTIIPPFTRPTSTAKQRRYTAWKACLLRIPPASAPCAICPPVRRPRHTRTNHRETIAPYAAAYREVLSPVARRDDRRTGAGRRHLDRRDRGDRRRGPDSGAARLRLYRQGRVARGLHRRLAALSYLHRPGDAERRALASGWGLP